jgi:hypothetical protein
MRIGASHNSKAKGSKKRGLDYHRRVYGYLRDHCRRPGSGLAAWTLLVPEENIGIVVEVKLNWKDGRDTKLLDEYLPIVKQAEGLEVVWPLLITQCLRGYPHPPILGLEKIEACQSWLVGDPTPLMLLI